MLGLCQNMTDYVKTVFGLYLVLTWMTSNQRTTLNENLSEALLSSTCYLFNGLFMWVGGVEVVNDFQKVGGKGTIF